MRSTETYFARALTHAADEQNITLTPEDIAILHTEHWHDHPEGAHYAQYAQENIDSHAQLAAAHHIDPRYGHP